MSINAGKTNQKVLMVMQETRGQPTYDDTFLAILAISISLLFTNLGVNLTKQTY